MTVQNNFATQNSQMNDDERKTNTNNRHDDQVTP